MFFPEYLVKHCADVWQQFNLILLSTSSRKNISIKILKEALGVKDDAEGAEYDDLEEANIGKN